jgi:hypothetical protein
VRCIAEGDLPAEVLVVVLASTRALPLVSTGAGMSENSSLLVVGSHAPVTDFEGDEVPPTTTRGWLDIRKAPLMPPMPFSSTALDSWRRYSTSWQISSAFLAVGTMRVPAARSDLSFLTRRWRALVNQ